jgi:hypothetical protein
MGYRSDFVFIIHGNGQTREMVQLYVWLHAKAEEELNNGTTTLFDKGWYNWLLTEGFDEDNSMPNDDYLYFADNSVKMYNFESIKDEILKYVEDVLGLEWEFTCVGEDSDDNTQESSCNCDTRSCISRHIVVDNG